MEGSGLLFDPTPALYRPAERIMVGIIMIDDDVTVCTCVPSEGMRGREGGGRTGRWDGGGCVQHW